MSKNVSVLGREGWGSREKESELRMHNTTYDIWDLQDQREVSWCGEPNIRGEW